jgi:hypothetical protein
LIVNLGIIGYAGYAFYTEAQLRRNPRVISAAIVGSVALLGLEGYVVETLRHNEGKDDTAVIAQYFHENPSKFQGLFGVCESSDVNTFYLFIPVTDSTVAVNVGVVGLTGYMMYKNWHALDTRTVAAVAGGVITLWAGEG